MSNHEIFSHQTNKSEPVANRRYNDKENLKTTAGGYVAAEKTSNRSMLLAGIGISVVAGLLATWYFYQQNFINKNIEQCHRYLEKKIVDSTTLTTCNIGYKDGDPRATAGLASIYYKNGDYEAALPVLHTCAEQEQINCQLLLSMLYKNGIKDHVKKDRFQALEWLERAHLNDSAFATFMLHLAYTDGDPELGLKKDPLKAKQYLKKAAALDYPEALYRQGYFYENGLFDYDKDLEKARHNYELAVKFNSNNALVPFSKILLNDGQTDLAVKYLERADRYNIPEGSYLLAKSYASSEEPEMQLKAIRILKRVIGSNIGETGETTLPKELKNNIDLLLAELYVKTNDREHYTETINEAIENHVPTAAYHKAMSYLTEFLIAEPYQVPEMKTTPEMPDNIKMAVKYLTMESENNHRDSLQQLFDILHNFRSKETDALLFKISQQLNEVDHFAGAYALGFCHGNGIGTPKNIEEAQKLYTDIIQNDPNKDSRITLASSLAYHYYTGKGNIISDNKDLKLGDLFSELLLKSDEQQGEHSYYRLWRKFIRNHSSAPVKEQKELLSIIDSLALIAEKYPAVLERNLDLRLNYIISKLLIDPKNSKNVTIRKEQLEQLALEQRHLPSIIHLAKQAQAGKPPYSKPDRAEEEKYLQLAIAEGDGWAAWRHATNLIEQNKPKDRPYDQIFKELRTAVENGFNEATLTIIKIMREPKIEPNVKEMISPEDYYYYLILAYRDQLLTQKDLNYIDEVGEKLTKEQLLKAENMLKNTPF